MVCANGELLEIGLVRSEPHVYQESQHERTAQGPPPSYCLGDGADSCSTGLLAKRKTRAPDDGAFDVGHDVADRGPWEVALDECGNCEVAAIAERGHNLLGQPVRHELTDAIGVSLGRESDVNGRR